MNTKRKTLVCVILLVVLLACALVVGIHQYVNRPEAITEAQFDVAFRDGLYTQVVVSQRKVVAQDEQGNRYAFSVEDPYSFVQSIQEDLEHFEILDKTQIINKLKPLAHED